MSAAAVLVHVRHAEAVVNSGYSGLVRHYCLGIEDTQHSSYYPQDIAEHYFRSSNVVVGGVVAAAVAAVVESSVAVAQQDSSVAADVNLQIIIGL